VGQTPKKASLLSLLAILVIELNFAYRQEVVPSVLVKSSLVLYCSCSWFLVLTGCCFGAVGPPVLLLVFPASGGAVGRFLVPVGVLVFPYWSGVPVVGPSCGLLVGAQVGAGCW
jgi:hypothetical protein